MPADWMPHIEAVARRLLGEPNRALTSRPQWRYGSHGSLRINVDKRGTWWSYQESVGGGVLDLIRREEGLADRAALEWLKPGHHDRAARGIHERAGISGGEPWTLIRGDPHPTDE